MNVLVTGSSGHLGEALMRSLADHGYHARGLDRAPGRFTELIGSITDRDVLDQAFDGVAAVIHTATLHKPHVATHDRQAFVDTNVTGTLAVLERACAAAVRTVVFTSTTSAFGAALTPSAGAPSAWIDETVRAVPKNIYGVTKTAAEDLCELFHRRHGVAVIVLRTSRFFPEPDDDPAVRDRYPDANVKANEFLCRRVDLEDAVTAHVAALARAAEIGFGRYVISATAPFGRDDLAVLRTDPESVVAARFPEYREIYRRCGFALFPSIDRVYVNRRAVAELGWRPRYDFARILAQLSDGEPIGSALARTVGSKGYHGDAAGRRYPFQ